MEMKNDIAPVISPSQLDLKVIFDFPGQITSFIVNDVKKSITVYLIPEAKVLPRCHKCQEFCEKIHSTHKRTIRDLPLSEYSVFIVIEYRNVFCPNCGISLEYLSFVDPFHRCTKRFESQVLGLCDHMSISAVACYVGLNWKTVKKIHKSYLQKVVSNRDFIPLKYLAIDEVALKKGHKYLTILLNWETGSVLWVGEGRQHDSIAGFFSSLSEEQIKGICAIAMDMWPAYIKAAKRYCPDAAIVFDFFHVVSMYGREIDKIRNEEYRNAKEEDKRVIKGSKFILLKNKENLNDREKPKLDALLNLNETISTAYILKDSLKKLWSYQDEMEALKSLKDWCCLALQSSAKRLRKFAKTMLKHAVGIINHCRFPINTGKLEGINNKIKVLKRRAYGFRDIEYFSLVIRCAFASSI